MTIVQYKQNIFVVRQYIQCYEEFRQANDLILILAEGVWGEGECGGRGEEGVPGKVSKTNTVQCTSAGITIRTRKIVIKRRFSKKKYL